MKRTGNPVLKTIQDYMIITVSIWIMVIGIYFFKFPNNFAFGGITGFSSVISAMTGISAGDFTFAANMALLIAGFLFLGKSVGVKTVYSSVLMSFSLSVLERLAPLSSTLTSEPLLELVFAVFFPAVGSAVLFYVGASSGGTDILAMILKKYSNMNIGMALLVVDVVAVAMAFWIFGPATGLYSVLGLTAKSLMIDQVIENINMCKCFSIICDNPEPICDYIINTLRRSATIYEAQGAFSHQNKTVIMVTMKRGQAVKLRNYIRRVEPAAFVQIYNSSEIIGNGFLTN